MAAPMAKADPSGPAKVTAPNPAPAPKAKDTPLGHKGRDLLGESLGLTTGGGTVAHPKESPSTAVQGASWANRGRAKSYEPRSETEASTTRLCERRTQSTRPPGLHDAPKSKPIV